MTLGRALDINVLQQAKGHFDRTGIPPGRLWVFEGRTLLLVGLGGIGNQVAQIAHGLGMNVIATRNSSRQGPPTVSDGRLFVESSDGLLHAYDLSTAIQPSARPRVAALRASLARRAS